MLSCEFTETINQIFCINEIDTGFLLYVKLRLSKVSLTFKYKLKSFQVFSPSFFKLSIL